MLETGLNGSARKYAEQISDAALAFLGARGIDGSAAATFRLGTVGKPDRGHEPYTGMLSIPYYTPAGVKAMRFRRLNDLGGAKYLSMPGDRPRLYNVAALAGHSDVLAVCEGELDAVLLHHVVGVPAVGVAGVNVWQSHFPRCVQGYERVLVFADSDDAGRDLSRRVCRDVENAIPIVLPEGEDVTDAYLKRGADFLLERAGLIDREDDGPGF